jgi:hypothetical protein
VESTKFYRRADFSGQRLGAVDAMLIVNDIRDKGAMTSLNLASNNLGGWNGKYGDAMKYDTSGKQNLSACHIYR